MRVATLLFLGSAIAFNSSAAHKERHWVSELFGDATTDNWRKNIGFRGPCDAPAYSARELSVTDAPSFGLPGSPAASPVTQIIKIEGEHKSYIVKFESLVGPLRFHPGDGVDYAVEGRRLFLQFAFGMHFSAGTKFPSVETA